MKELVLISGLVTGFAALVAVILAGIGVRGLVTGRCKLFRKRLEGRAARIAGVFLTLPLVLGAVTLPIFNPTRVVHDETARILMPLLAALVVACALLLALRQAGDSLSRT
jgi:hypothetical protein